MQVPLAFVGSAVSTPAETDGTVGQHHLAVFVEGDSFPLGVVGSTELAIEVGGAYITVGHHHHLAAGQGLLFQHHQHRHVGVTAHVVVKISAALALVGEVELFQDDMAHGHGDRSIGALLGFHPDVRQLGDFRVVGRDGHGLGAFVAHLGEEVGVGCACLRHVGTPGNDERRVVPVG